MKHAIPALIVSMLLTFCLCAGAHAAESGDTSIDKPTQADLVAMWEELAVASTAFSSTPQVCMPFAPGGLTQEYQYGGLAYLNFIRACANLSPVRLDPAVSTGAQYGAVLLAALDDLSHSPVQPVGMSDYFYQRAAEAVSFGNVAYRLNSPRSSMLSGAIQDCIDDNGLNNLAVLGHRRWFLNPALLNVGFGYAESFSGGGYVVVPVTDMGNRGADYDFVAWPASGAFPVQVFEPCVPWSVTVNPARYQLPEAGKIQVTLTRLQDGKSWHFDSGTGGPIDNGVAYFAVDDRGCGVSNCIIFNPASWEIPAYSGDWRVRITGLRDRKGKAATLDYTVEFFDLRVNNHAWEPWTTVVPATCVEAGEQYRVCGVCGLEETRTVPPAGHDQVVTVRVEPTIFSGGLEICGCPWCNTLSKKELPALGNPFRDVREDRFYYDSVLWAANQGVTSGTGADRFSPEGKCSRAQVITFLWRACGSPEPESKHCAFVDVKPGKYYTQAVLWAVENGITAGVDETHFGTDRSVSRAQFVTFLWRAAGEPEQSGSTAFRDVPADKYYARAVAWAAERGITAGKGGGLFAPEDVCTRGHVATFLCRMYR